MMFFILPVLNLLGFFLGFAPVQGYPRALHFLREDSKGHVFVDFDTYSWPPFTPTTSPTNLCSDSTGYLSAPNGPDSKECAALLDSITPGYWTITADPPGYVTDNFWVILGSSGHCYFAVGLKDNSVDVSISSQDVRDIINGSLTLYPDMITSDTITCTDNVLLQWVLYKSSIVEINRATTH